MNLSPAIKSWLPTFGKLRLLTGNTTEISLNLPFIYQFVGTSNQCEVEIKKTSEEKGWAYDDKFLGLILEFDEGKFSLIESKELRALIQEVFKEKKFSEDLSPGYLSEFNDGRVVGCIDTKRFTAQ